MRRNTTSSRYEHTGLTHPLSIYCSLPAQVSRFYRLDDFVHFGCARCAAFKPADVHSWDAHFAAPGEDGACATCAYPSAAKQSAAEAAMEQRRKQEAADAEKREEDGSGVLIPNPKDVRTMRCKICDHAEDKAKFLPMQVN